MEEKNLYPIKDYLPSHYIKNREQYEQMYRQSIDHPEKFWADQARRLDWIKPFNKVKDCSFKNDVHIRWFEGGKLNVSANCLDRHLAKRADQIAIIWEPNDPQETSKKITYRELHKQVCTFANVLKARGVKKGDTVTLYLPMIPEAVYAMLACTRIGAVHSVVFGGFSPESLSGRILDCKSQFVITADEGVRGEKRIPLKASVDEALKKCPDVKTVLVVKRTGGSVSWKEGRDVWYVDETSRASSTCEPEVMDAEDPLFILYTSGSTGQPKGVLHTTAGYLLYTAMSHEIIFNYKPGDIYWCTADIGWITGHSYIVYGPLANGATTLMFEGIPNYPTYSRHWEVIDKHQVNIYYTAPTAIRSLMAQGKDPVLKTSRKSLKLLGSVGEPINPQAWRWYHDVVGNGRCAIVDTWWQTETGGILITPLLSVSDLKPGSASLPFFGIVPAILSNEGKALEGTCEGNLCILDSWPGQARTIYGDHPRFIQNYFTQFPGKYFTGDGCHRDEDGYYWITGRVDDEIKVSGHRLGTAEIESAFVAHPKVAESAVVGYPHPIKGQGIYAFVTLDAGVEATEELRLELVKWVREKIGAVATPDIIQWAPQLPKTRSGKIMRRILKKIAAGDISTLGDVSTLADSHVVENLIQNRATDQQNRK